ncbi:MAG: RNase adapter RapZ, partial [Isosphaeraceae bacterium]
MKRRRAASDGRQLVILTGVSGSGKSTVLKTFEDLGYYCVDNLPVRLIPAFSQLDVYGDSEIQRAALLIDAREGEQLKELPEIYKQIRHHVPATLVYMEASDEALLRRFS